ncbi:carcinine transporter [Scaptodrosophila lebanonensis]|uniref:Carcinine transporter n=1 Tax=Drosophila lebanonensis TaxID=7225 RepID=A0A6J2T9W7_DROLE|nr:carcinine transporter [Scaptodrosophila lebanonensis]
MTTSGAALAPLPAHVRESLQHSFADISQFLDFDDLLPLIGEFGAYQKLLFLLMIPFCFIAAFIYLGQIFMTLPPKNHYCHVFELHTIKTEEERKALSIPKEADGSYSQCKVYDANWTHIRSDVNRPNKANTSWPVIPCPGKYVYNIEEEPFFTATMQFHWVCENRIYATYSQMAFFLGCVVGSLWFGWFGDRCGRLAAVVSSCAIAIVGSFITSLSNEFSSFATARFIVGLSFDTCFTMIYILVLEYVGPKYRTFVANMSLALFYSPFTCAMPWLALLCGHWKRFSLLMSFPIILALFSYCILPESARWLVSVGQAEEAIKILRRVAQVNKKTVQPSVFDHFRNSCRVFYKEEIDGRNFTVFSTFRRHRLCRHMLLMSLIWMAMSLLYDGHVRAGSVLDNNVLIIFTIACATEIPGNLLLILTLDRVGRRWSSFISTICSGIFSLIAAKLSSASSMIVAAIVGRFFANISYNIGLQWAAEVLPTVVRAQGVAFIHTLGFMAMMTSPPIIYLSQVSMSLMLSILGCVGIVAGILTLLLPETLYQDLPQTLSDGADFGKEQRIWHVPCCGPGSHRHRRPRRIWHTGSSLRTLSRDEYRSKKLHRNAIRIRASRASASNRTSIPVRTDESIEDEIEEVHQSYKYDNHSKI